jgi:hypothetical protein
MQFVVITSTLEDGSEVHDLMLETEATFVPVWAAPTASAARNAEHLLNLVATRLLDCGSDREVFALVAKVQEALQ